MELTGAAKEAFEKWYMNSEHAMHNISSKSEWMTIRLKYSIPSMLYSLPDSMKYGIYVDWFDSVGISIITDIDVNKMQWFAWIIESNRVKLMSEGNGRNVLYFDTRSEARTAAIQKANELFNNK